MSLSILQLGDPNIAESNHGAIIVDLAHASPAGFDTNCLLTALTADLILATRQPRAVGPAAPVPVGHLTTLTSRPPLTAATYTQVIKLMAAAGPGARAIVAITPAAGQDTHFINAHTINAGGEELELIPSLNSDPTWVETVANWLREL